MKEPYRLSMIPEASGASHTRLYCRPGPDDHAEKDHSISKAIVTKVEWAIVDSNIRATTWTTRPPIRVLGLPIRSVIKPPNLEPIKVAMPKAKRATLTFRPLMDVMVSRKGAIYEYITPYPNCQKNVTPRPI